VRRFIGAFKGGDSSPLYHHQQQGRPAVLALVAAGKSPHSKAAINCRTPNLHSTDPDTPAVTDPLRMGKP